MGRFLDAAFEVLSKANKPLSAKDITDTALKDGLLVTQGKTPWQTMKSKLSTDILDKKKRSNFMRTSEGNFALRSWTARENEYIAQRFKKSLLDEEIVVFPASSLTKYIPGPGLHTITLRNGRELVTELRPMLRREAEEDFNVIQLVSVFIIKYKSKYLTYKRTKRLPESRLHGWYSAIFGGHLNTHDYLPLFDVFDPKNAYLSFYRELEEELVLSEDNAPKIVYKGLLYDDSREVSRQHLGVVYDVYLKSAEYLIGERGFLIDPKFETLPEIKTRIEQFENWSVVIINFESRN